MRRTITIKQNKSTTTKLVHCRVRDLRLSQSAKSKNKNGMTSYVTSAYYTYANAMTPLTAEYQFKLNTTVP